MPLFRDPPWPQDGAWPRGSAVTSKGDWWKLKEVTLYTVCIEQTARSVLVNREGQQPLCVRMMQTNPHRASDLGAGLMVLVVPSPASTAQEDLQSQRRPARETQHGAPAPRLEQA